MHGMPAEIVDRDLSGTSSTGASIWPPPLGRQFGPPISKGPCPSQQKDTLLAVEGGGASISFWQRKRGCRAGHTEGPGASCRRWRRRVGTRERRVAGRDAASHPWCASGCGLRLAAGCSAAGGVSHSGAVRGAAALPVPARERLGVAASASPPRTRRAALGLASDRCASGVCELPPFSFSLPPPPLGPSVSPTPP